MSNNSPAPAKPPRTYESDVDQIENIEPAVIAQVTGSTGQSAAKRRAPQPPTAYSVPELSPLHTSTPVHTVPSPIKMMKVDSPSSETKDTIGRQEDAEVTSEMNASSKVVNRETSKMGHVSSATLIFGGSKSTPAKVAVIQKTSSKPSSESSADDSMCDEPTRQPVAARLAAWQTKQAPSTNHEPLAVSSRVKNYEKKMTVSKNSKSPVKPRPCVEPATDKPATVKSVKMSPARTVVPTASPVKSTLSSPQQKVSPATRAIQERLTQICEAGTRNAAVDREREERAAELANVENRWQAGTPPPTPPLPSSITMSTAGVAGSLKAKTQYKMVPSSPAKTNSPQGKPPTSPSHCQNASPCHSKREVARDKIRSGINSPISRYYFEFMMEFIGLSLLSCLAVNVSCTL